MTHIDPSIIEDSMDYAAYWQLIQTLFEEGKTTGPIQNEAMLEYTRLNIARMRRLDKTTKLKEPTLKSLSKIDRPLIWLTLTEAWCGDAAQVIPVLSKMAGANPNIQLKLILRDEHLNVMDAFLTNGGRSIPKIIIVDAEEYKVLESWGPRPTEAQQLVMDARLKAELIEDKIERKAFWNEVKKNTQLWYAKDKTIAVQSEMMEMTLQILGK